MEKPTVVRGLLAIFVIGLVTGVEFKAPSTLDFDFSLDPCRQSLLLIVFTAIVINLRMKDRKMNLPPGPTALPIVGNWLKVSLR